MDNEGLVTFFSRTSLISGIRLSTLSIKPPSDAVESGGLLLGLQVEDARGPSDPVSRSSFYRI